MKVVSSRTETDFLDFLSSSPMLWDFQIEVNLESRFNHGKNFPPEFKARRRKSDEGEGQALERTKMADST